MTAAERKPEPDRPLRVVGPSELPEVVSWKRSVRRFRARGIMDPLLQSIVTLTLASAFGALGIYLAVAHGLLLAGPVLLLAAALASSYYSVVFDALRRDKTLQYWRECRNLERKLTRERAHRTLIARTLDRLGDLDEVAKRGAAPPVHRVLGEVTTELFKALASRYHDVAVVLTHETDGYYRILDSAHSRGSRWKSLKPGKYCSAAIPAQTKLGSLADHHHTVEVRPGAGSLRISVLTDIPLHERDIELIDQMPACIRLIATYWRPTQPASGVRQTVAAVGDP